MNDRFKFRVYDKRTKKLYDTRIISYINGNIERVDVVGNSRLIIFDDYADGINNIILMQCTGLKDKNGKLIYEDDIVLEVNGKHHIVKWNNNHATFFIEKIEKTGLFTDTWHLARHNLDYEVIGNIWEDAELLEE